MDILTLTLNPCVDRTLWVEELDGEPYRIEEQSGGKGINVARVLARLGADCTALAPVGGENGALFSRLAAQEGVRLCALPIAASTRTVNTYVRRRDFKQRVVVGEAPHMTPDEIEALIELTTARLHTARAFCVCGSACCVEAAQAGALLLARARDMGVATLLDSNGPALSLGFAARPALIKPNQRELAELTGCAVADGGEEDAARALIEKGASQVLVSLGEKGAMLVCADHTQFCPAPRIDPVNPVGSGDSFVAGYLYALLRGQSDAGALCWACAAGAANAGMFPAARITREDIERILGYTL